MFYSNFDHLQSVTTFSYNLDMETSVDSNGIELVSMAAIEDEVTYLISINLLKISMLDTLNH